MNREDDQLILKVAKEIALGASKKLSRFQKEIKSLKVTYKKAQGVASKADIETEKYIISKIKSSFREHTVFAEESSYFEGVNRTKKSLQKIPYCWVIDPLDGTHNFLNGSDYFCVSIAVLKFGKPYMGVVYRPSTKEMFHAISGKGAWYENEGKRRKGLYLKSNNKKLSDSLLVTGFSTEKGVFNGPEYKLFGKIMKNCRGVRRFGSAALDLCYVSLGVWDGFWERDLAAWDVSAAGLICLESGVRVTNFQGEHFDPFHKSIMAFRSPLFKKVATLF